MKKKISNYCMVLLTITICFGLFQAKKQTRNPFRGSTPSNSSTFDYEPSSRPSHQINQMLLKTDNLTDNT